MDAGAKLPPSSSRFIVPDAWASWHRHGGDADYRLLVSDRLAYPEQAGYPMAKGQSWYSVLYVQVIIAIIIGALIGYFSPTTGVALKPLGDAFIALIKMMIAPIIFCNIVHGISSMSDMKKVGRVGVKTLVYFEFVSTLALIVGIVLAMALRPGSGFNIDPATLDPKAVQHFVTDAQHSGVVPFLLGIIPDTFVDALSSGVLLQVLLIAVLTGVAVAHLGPLGEAVTRAVGTAGKVVFAIVRIIVKAAPIGALGAMAFTVGKYGTGSLFNLLQLILTFYVTALIFIVVVLGSIARLAGFSIFRFLAYIKDELLIVLGTSSSETVLPQMMDKLQRLGASESVVGLVFPTGYSFNTDGSNIYITLCVLFLAQATNTHLDAWQLFAVLGFAMLTSKGGSGVSGGGFVTLAATLAVVPDVPIQALALLLGIDKFMSECRAITNIVGNGVATIVISRWENELDSGKLGAIMADPVGARERAMAESLVRGGERQ
jgi:aerobic C4-dicarboxylate transport protein